MSDLDGRVVLITGAGGGIGSAMASGFRADGARVAGCDLGDGAARAEEVCDLAAVCDVTDPDQMRSFADRVADELGSIDVAIANAGIGRRATIEEADWADIADVLRVNLDGVIHTVRAVLPHMRRQGHGRIIAVTSRNAEVCPPKLVGYSVSKAGVVAFTRTLAHELGETDDILVNNLIPGPIETALNPRGVREAESCYPTVKLLATLPAGGPSGRTFFDGEEYPIFTRFSDDRPASMRMEQRPPVGDPVETDKVVEHPSGRDR